MQNFFTEGEQSKRKKKSQERSNPTYGFSFLMSEGRGVLLSVFLAEG